MAGWRDLLLGHLGKRDTSVVSSATDFRFSSGQTCLTQRVKIRKKTSRGIVANHTRFPPSVVEDLGKTVGLPINGAFHRRAGDRWPLARGG